MDRMKTVMLAVRIATVLLCCIEVPFLPIGFDLVVTVALGLDMDDFAHAPSGRCSLDRNDEIDGLTDHVVHRR